MQEGVNMGKGILDFLQNKINKESKITFFSTAIITLLVHLFAFTNVLPTHDSVYIFYGNSDMTISGRWFLGFANGISSYFDIPWLIGIISTVYIALTAVIIVDIFKVKNPIVMVILGGLLSAFPAITKTFQYSFTADGYILSMLLAATTVWLSVFERRKPIHLILAVITICLSCAIYQSYVSFALLLMLCYFIYEVLENRHSTKELWFFVLKQIGIYGFGMALYYAIWRICLLVKNIEAIDYQGISDMQNLGSFFEVSIPFRLLDGTIKSIKMFSKTFFERSLNDDVSLYAIFNIVFLVISLVILVIAFIKSGLYRRKIQCFMAICAILLFIPCAHIWFYATLDVWYYLLMEQPICVLYLFVVILCERWLTIKLKNITALFFALMIANNAIIGNISYIFMHRSYEHSYANGLEMVLRIRDFEDSYEDVAFIGHVPDAMVRDMEETARDQVYLISAYQYTNLLFNHEHASLFLENTFHVDYIFADGQRLQELSENEIVNEMGVWPSKNSIKVIDDTLVIKLSD